MSGNKNAVKHDVTKRKSGLVQNETRSLCHWNEKAADYSCLAEPGDEEIPEYMEVVMQAVHEATEQFLPQIFPCLQHKEPE